MNPAAMTLGRFLLVLFFLIEGANRAMDLSGTTSVIASKGLPQPHVLAALTIMVEIGASLLVIFNRFMVPAALALAAFCLGTGLVFHNFWVEVDAATYLNQFNHFMKNIALAGAFLTVAAMPSMETIAVLRHRVARVEPESRPADA
jgi:putative oxidoreductase